MPNRTAAASGGLDAAGRGTGLLVFAFLGGSICLAFFSSGVHHDDDLVHFLMARWTWHHWEYLLHPWGRPGMTLPLAIVSWVGDVDTGWLLARIFSACVTAAGAWLAANLAVRLGVRRSWLVVLACYLQPLNAVLSYTTLTENFAALHLIAAASLLVRNRALAAGFVFSIAMITRYELVVFYPIWLVAVWFAGAAPRQKLAAVAGSFFAPVLYNVLFYVLLNDWPARLYFAGTGSTRYTAVGILSYIPHLCYAVTPTLVGLAVVGGIAMVRRGRPLVPAIAGTYLAIHLFLRAFGLFASGGFGRFMVTVAPFVAILCVEGVAELARVRGVSNRARYAWLTMAVVFAVAMLGMMVEEGAGRIALPGGWLRHLTLWLPLLPIGLCCLAALEGHRVRGALWGAGVTLSLLCLLQWAATVRPLELVGWPRRTGDAVAWMASQGYLDRPVFAATPWVAYWMGQVEEPRLDKGPSLLASMPVGTIVVWDSLYCPSDFHRLPQSELLDNPAYRQVARFEPEDRGDGNTIVVFEKTDATPLPAHETAPYPPNLMIRRGRACGIYYTNEARPAGMPQSAR